jgi:hypothetical protein
VRGAKTAMVSLSISLRRNLAFGEISLARLRNAFLMGRGIHRGDRRDRGIAHSGKVVLSSQVTPYPSLIAPDSSRRQEEGQLPTARFAHCPICSPVHKKLRSVQKWTMNNDGLRLFSQKACNCERWSYSAAKKQIKEDTRKIGYD